MIRVERILFPTDFSRCADQALLWASELASHFNAELHVVHGLAPTPRYARSESAAAFATLGEELGRIASEKLSTLAQNLSGPKATFTWVSAATSPAIAILDAAQEHDIDLIVLGTHGHRGPAHLVLGSVAEELVRTAPCPTLSVREQEQPVPIADAETILVPLDLSQHSRDALIYAKELASSYSASLQLFHVVQQQAYPSFYALKPTQFSSSLGDIHRRVREQLDWLMAETMGPKVPYECFVVEGQATAEILDFATREKSSLIVIPTHGVTGLKRFFLGSVTEKVVRRAPCPVLTIRSYRKSLIPNANAVEDALDFGHG